MKPYSGVQYSTFINLNKLKSLAQDLLAWQTKYSTPADAPLAAISCPCIDGYIHLNDRKDQVICHRDDKAIKIIPRKKYLSSPETLSPVKRLLQCSIHCTSSPVSLQAPSNTSCPNPTQTPHRPNPTRAQLQIPSPSLLAIFILFFNSISISPVFFFFSLDLPKNKKCPTSSTRISLPASAHRSRRGLHQSTHPTAQSPPPRIITFTT